LAGHETHATRSAMAGPTVMRKIDAVAQSGVQQHFAAARLKTLSIDRDFAIDCHCPFPNAFREPPHKCSYEDNQAKNVVQAGKTMVASPSFMLAKFAIR